MDTLLQGSRAAFSGIFSLVPLIFTYATTLPLGKALRTISLLLCVFGLSTIVIKQVSLFKREYDYQAILTATAILKNASCHTLEDVLRYDTSVIKTCTEALRTVQTSAFERALVEVVEGWPTPWDVGAFLLTSFENKLMAISLVIWAGSSVLPYIVGPPMQMMRKRYVNGRINQLQKMYTPEQ